MQNQANKTPRTFQIADNTSLLPKSFDGDFGDSYENKKYNAALYCRLSKEDADKQLAGDDSESIRNQKLMLTEYADKQGFKIYKVYADDDYGGFSDRPQFKAMLKDAEKGLFDIILCKHQSRFTRDLELVEKYIHGLFILWGIRFISLTDHVDTAVRGGKKSRQINGLINEWYCEDLSENVKSVIRAKREKGQYVGAYVSYGYLKDSRDRHKLAIDEEAADTVRKIFNMYLSGVGIHSIATHLTEMGVPTPTQHKERLGINYKNGGLSPLRPCGVWSVNTVRRILRNETYTGNMVQGRERSVSYKTKKLAPVPKDEWIIAEGTHEPIIDRKTFDTVQNLLDNKRTLFYENAVKPAKQRHLLAGKVICMYCGRAMHRSGASRNGKDRYLACKQGCASKYISQNKLQELIALSIRQLVETVINENGYDSFIRDILDELGEGSLSFAAKKNQLAEAEAAIAKCDKNIAAAYNDKLNGLISEEDFMNFRRIFNEEKQAAVLRRTVLIQEIENAGAAPGASDIQELLDERESVDLLTHECFNGFLSAVHVGGADPVTNEREIVICWNF